MAVPPSNFSLTKEASSIPFKTTFFSSPLRNNTYPIAFPTNDLVLRGRKAKLVHPTIVSSNYKIVRCPPLDQHAVKNNKIRFVQKLKTLLLSKPRHFLPLRVLSRCRSYLSLPPSRSLLTMVLRYPAIFRLFYAPSRTSQSLFLLSVGLTPEAATLAAHESQLKSHISFSLATKLQKLLMLSSHRRLLLSKLVHLGPDFGLPPNFRSRLCNCHPDLFRTVDTSYGRALELVSWNPNLAIPFPPIIQSDGGLIMDRPPKFKQLKLRKGLNLKRRHKDYLIRFQELPEVSPYSEDLNISEGTSEKRACAVVREVLRMTLEKRTLVDHLTHFRKDFGLPNKLRALLVRHPEMFYVSLKGKRDSVFLVEGYDDKGRLVETDELLAAKERLMELVREGKRMRRDIRKSTDYLDDDDSDDKDDDSYDQEDDDGFQDLFDSGIGPDWEDFNNGVYDDAGAEVAQGELSELEEFWTANEISAERGEQLGDSEIW